MELHFEDSNTYINIRNEKYYLSFWHKHLILGGVPVTHLEIFMIARIPNLPILSSQVTLWKNGCLFQNGFLVFYFDPIFFPL